MRILIIASAYNSLSQRVFAELYDRDHAVAVALALSDEALREAVRTHDPELIVAPMLTTAIPEDIWSTRTCLIVHPGPPGDRGPSALDWALHEGRQEWGVTVLQADAEMDAGDIWASQELSIPPGVSKSDLYRNEVADAASRAVLRAVRRFGGGDWKPRPAPEGRARPLLRQELRAIDWRHEGTEAVSRKLRAADSSPGVLDELYGREYFLHGGHPEDTLRGHPGELLATRAGALCRATADGAVWITQVRPRRTPDQPEPVKLPAALALREGLVNDGVPESDAPLDLPAQRRTRTDIRYSEDGQVGFLRFSFPGGAMSTGHCRRLLAAYRHALSRPTRVLVLGGTRDFFSNGIHLHAIEASPDPARESWDNITAMDDLVETVLTTTDRFVIAAVGGNAAAGGMMMALAADEVWCRAGAVLNPHYRLMGLHGSEYWTYTLPRRVGAEEAGRLTRQALPVSTERALAVGLVDEILTCEPEGMEETVAELAQKRATDPLLDSHVADKHHRLESVLVRRTLAAHRETELAAMRRNFAPGHPYHVLRADFTRKRRPESTPEHLARYVARDTSP